MSLHCGMSLHFCFLSTDLSLMDTSVIMDMSKHTVATQTTVSTPCLQSQSTWTVDAQQEIHSVQHYIKCEHSYGANIDRDLDDCHASDQDNVMDTSFIVGTTDSETEGSMDSEVPSCESPSSEKKYLVFESCLRRLFQTGPVCLQHIIETNMETSWSSLSVQYVCTSGHVSRWCSQPHISGMAAGNLLLSAAILFSGGSYTKFAHLANTLNLVIPAERTFHRIQSTYLFPVIHRTWTRHQQLIFQRLQGQDLKISGDGRCDSPGYSAKYCTYTLMLQESGEIVDFRVVQVTETTSSVAMEKETFRHCIDGLRDTGLKVSMVATDRHTGIAALCRTVYPEINHQFDVWHVCKNLMKKLTKAGKQRECEDLLPWVRSICNHLWWSCETCKGDKVLLKEKWLSILHHTANLHTWGGSHLFSECSHPPLLVDREERTKWLTPGSHTHQVLSKLVMDKPLLKALDQMTAFCHTGSLEVYHSVLIKYCEKRQHYSYEGMIACTQLAVLDNNHNLGGAQATTLAGDPRYRISHPKGRSDWVAKPISEKKAYPYLADMMAQVVEMWVTGTTLPHPDLPNLPRNIAPTPRPQKEEVIARHQSRFSQ